MGGSDSFILTSASFDFVGGLLSQISFLGVLMDGSVGFERAMLFIFMFMPVILVPILVFQLLFCVDPCTFPLGLLRLDSLNSEASSVFIADL